MSEMTVKCDINVYFVRGTEKNSNNEPILMLDAHKLCIQKNIDAKWITIKECKSMKCSTDVVIVIHKFEGNLFDYIREHYQFRILGPWCLIVCLTDGIPIPSLTVPILNMAMRDCHVTCSSLTSEEREAIKNKVETMAGSFSNSLFQTTTHLITNSSKFKNYINPIENNIIVMVPEWIDAIWNDSQHANVEVNSVKYDKYKLKPFHNLTIAITGIADKQEKKCLIQKIKTYGGCYRKTLQLDKLDILICEDDVNTKFRAASLSHDVKCVNKDWIEESISKGYVLPEDNFKVKRSALTPTKDNLPMCSMLNVIKPGTSNDLQNTYNKIINITNDSIMNLIEINKSDVIDVNTPSLSSQEKLSSISTVANDKIDDNLGNRFLGAPSSHAPVEEVTKISKMSNESSDKLLKLNVFDGATFKIKYFDGDTCDNIKCLIEGMSGEVINQNYKKIKTNYVVLPIFIDNPYKSLSMKTVTDLWVRDCHATSTMIDVEYYHKPIVVKQAKLLRDYVICCTNYNDCERLVLDSLVEALGGISQCGMSRISISNKNVLKTTHLISPNNDGIKCKYATMWNIPIVTKDWLLECGRLGQIVSLNSYIVSENSMCVSKNSFKSEDDHEQLQLQELSYKDKSYKVEQTQEDDEEFKTEVEQIRYNKTRKTDLNGDLSGTSGTFTTPKGTIKNSFEFDDIKTPETVCTPVKYDPLHNIPTPETPLGAFLDANPSPNLRKAFRYLLNKMPGDEKPPTRRLSTPLSEIKHRCWQHLLGNDYRVNENDVRVDKNDVETEEKYVRADENDVENDENSVNEINK